jgi:transposase-like protein
MATQKAISLIKLQKEFSTHEACEMHLFRMKWPEGYRCAKCSHDQSYEIKSRKYKLFQCKQCGYQATVLVGTVMEKTHIDLNKWFLAIYLVAHDKRGISAVKLSKDIDISYKAAWLMLHKIRDAMGKRDSNYTLAGIVELDDAYFGAPTEGGKRGRGTEKTQVLVALSLTQNGNPLFAKMEIIPNLRGSTLAAFANKSIDSGSTISTDAYRSYSAIAKENFEHKPQNYDAKENPDHLNWLHTIVSNVKAFIAGTFHGLESKHLQAYLDEFCYRFNRRKFNGQFFNRLLSCCASTTKICYSELTQ